MQVKMDQQIKLQGTYSMPWMQVWGFFVVFLWALGILNVQLIYSGIKLL